MTKQLKRLDLFVREIQDPHAQENFWRLKRIFEDISVSGVAGPPGPPGPAGAPGEGLTKITVIIPAGATVDIDSNLLSTFNSIEYAITFSDGSTVRFNKFQVDKIGTSTVQDQVFARSGASFNMSLSALVVGLSCNVRVTNSGPVALEARFTKNIL